MNLAQFVQTFQDAITRTVLATYPPLYSARDRAQWAGGIKRLRRRPLGGQADAIGGVALSLRRHRGTNLVGEMGTGKTTIAAAAAYLAGFQRVLVLGPTHLVRKWRREVVATVPGAHACIVSSVTDLTRLTQLPGRPLFVILSRERAKLSYRWSPAAVERVIPGREESQRRLCCPACFAPVLDSEGVPMGWADLERKKQRCRRCRSPLWQADRSGPRRFALADYIARRMPGFFDLLVIDEQQEYKARGSAQGLAAGTLAEACGRVLTLTGTLSGGYASTLFYLLWRFSKEVREEFSYHDEQRWIARYGVLERITQKGDDEAYEDGRVSRRRGYRTRVVEKPGVAPSVLLHLIGNSVFLRLSDVAAGLPEYREEVRLVPLERGESSEEPSQYAHYQRLASQLRAAVMQSLAHGSKRLLAAYLQSLLAFPDACCRGETVLDSRTGEVIASVAPLPEDRLYPKEQALLDIVREERRRSRRVLVYVSHTASRDITPRLESLLRQDGHRVATLKADTVPAERREEWVARRVKEGLDVLLVHPRLVSTGLDLIAFPTIVFQEVEFSVYTMRQASRRSWRIGQAAPVRVVALAYQGTLQAQALALVARKLQSSLAIEGELMQDGLATFGDDGEDMLMALARSLTERVEASEESLEGLFASARMVGEDAETFLGQEDWEQEEEHPSIITAPLDPAALAPFVGLPLFGARPRDGSAGQPTPALAGATREETRPSNGEQLRLF